MDVRRLLGADHHEDRVAIVDELTRYGKDEPLVSLWLIELFQGICADLLRTHGAVEIPAKLGRQDLDAGS